MNASNKVLLITGGSSGIGKATVDLFAQHGWEVFELSRHGVSDEIAQFFLDGIFKLVMECCGADDRGGKRRFQEGVGHVHSGVGDAQQRSYPERPQDRSTRGLRTPRRGC